MNTQETESQFQAPQSQGPSGRGLKRAAFIVAIVALVLVAWGLFSRHSALAELRDRTEEQAIPVVKLTTPRADAASRDLILPGELQAYSDAPIYAQTTGFVKRWHADIGTTVKAGQLLAELDTPEVDQQYSQAKADLETAQANYTLAKTTAERWQALFKADSVSQQDLDARNGDAASKRAALASAQANVDRLRALENFKRVVAPFAGVVTTRNIDVGDLVEAGATSGREIFHVADTHLIRIYVQVPQTFAAQIKPGTNAEISFAEQPGHTYTAKLVGTSEALDTSSKTLRVQLQADNSSGALLAGAYAQVNFKLANSAQSFRLPGNTLLFNASGTQIATVGNDNKVVVKPVTVGRDFGNEIEIIDGLSAQDRVVLSPSDSIESGDPVRIAPAASGGGGASASK